MALQQRLQMALDEDRLAIKDIDRGLGDLAMDQQGHADPLHGLQHRRDRRRIRDPRRRIGGGVGRIELAGREHTVGEAGRDLGRVDRVGEVGGEQRRERASVRQGRLDAFAVGPGRRHRGDRRPQVGHHDRPGELPRRVGHHGLQHGAIAQMHMPVVGLTDREALDSHGQRQNRDKPGLTLGSGHRPARSRRLKHPRAATLEPAAPAR